MLVLERPINTAIRIGSDIRILVVDIPGKRRVRLGLEVPGGTLIWREELGLTNAPQIASAPKPPTHSSHLDVLIVEDDPAHARLIEKAFARAGNVSTAVLNEGPAVLPSLQQRLEQGKSLPGLIVLDLYLGSSSGLEVLQSLKQDNRLCHLPVVMLSGLAKDDDVTACLDAGANAFLAKTDDYRSFCDLVIRIAEFWRHHRHTTAPALRDNGNNA